MSEILVAKLSRQELYDKIWEISVAGVSKEYGIPYAQMMKQVKAANIPVPPSGYWTKLRFGKPVEKTPLSDPRDAEVALTKSVTDSIPREAISAPATQDTDKAVLEAPVAEIMSPPHGSGDATSNNTEAPEPVETREQYGQTYNIYNREKLYQEVWEKPVTEVAKRYKVSDVAIHKVCKSLNIPTPGLGYWAKVKAGKPVKQTPLPHSDKAETKTGIRTGLEPRPKTAAAGLQFLPPEDQSAVLSVAAQIMLPDENSRMHPKIIAHRKKVASWQKESRNKDPYWIRRNKDRMPFLADTVSEATLPRVCRIFDALIKAMEPLGCSLTDDLKFVVNGETVFLSIVESQDKVEHVPTREENMQLLKYEEEKKKYSLASKPNIRKYDYVYNGQLSLRVGSEKSIRDAKANVIEDRLGDVILLLYQASNALRVQREEQEAAERKREEEERLRNARRERYNQDVECTNALVNEAEDFEIACKIRAYISAVEQKETLAEEEAAWIEWAKLKADWYDPTVKRKDEFLGTREHSENKEQKKLENSYRSWYW